MLLFDINEEYTCLFLLKAARVYEITWKCCSFSSLIIHTFMTMCIQFHDVQNRPFIFQLEDRMAYRSKNWIYR